MLPEKSERGEMNEVLEKLQRCSKGEVEEVVISSEEAYEFLEWVNDELTESFNDGYDQAREDFDNEEDDDDWGYRDWDDHDVEY